jgi:hypothetical protein
MGWPQYKALQVQAGTVVVVEPACVLQVVVSVAGDLEHKQACMLLTVVVVWQPIETNAADTPVVMPVVMSQC